MVQILESELRYGRRLVLLVGTGTLRGMGRGPRGARGQAEIR